MMDEEKLKNHTRRREGDEDEHTDELDKEAHLNLYTIACPDPSDKGALPEVVRIPPNAKRSG